LERVLSVGMRRAAIRHRRRVRGTATRACRKPGDTRLCAYGAVGGALFSRARARVAA
jgi:hypothetical protein